MFGVNAIGVVLTGNLGDGAAGLWAIKELGGVAIVQDPEEAMYPSMPQNAIESVNVDYVVRLSELPALLVKVTSAPEREVAAHFPEGLEGEVRISNQQDPLQTNVENLGDPSFFSCPECHGVLLQMMEGSHFRFRCHTGHAYSADSLLSHIQDQIEIQLWNAIRAMQEGNLLMRTMAEHLGQVHGRGSSRALLERAQDLQWQANELRQLVISSAAPIQTI